MPQVRERFTLSSVGTVFSSMTSLLATVLGLGGPRMCFYPRTWQTFKSGQTCWWLSREQQKRTISTISKCNVSNKYRLAPYYITCVAYDFKVENVLRETFSEHCSELGTRLSNFVVGSINLNIWRAGKTPSHVSSQTLNKLLIQHGTCTPGTHLYLMALRF